MKLNSWFFGFGAEYHHSGGLSQNMIGKLSLPSNADISSYENLTLQLYAKKEFGYGAIKPFAALSLGSHIFGFTELLIGAPYNIVIESEGGPFVNPQVGVNYSLNDKIGVNFSVGYRLDFPKLEGYNGNHAQYFDEVVTAYKRLGSGLSFHLGITF